jgi:hypothetical protein
MNRPGTLRQAMMDASWSIDQNLAGQGSRHKLPIMLPGSPAIREG